MKKLNNLIPDIYKELEDLSKGQPLPLSKDNIDKTMEGIKNAILSLSDPSERNKDFTLRMSNVGKPTRQLWFEKRDSEQNTASAPLQIKFLYGHLLEEILLMLARMSGHTVTDEQKEVKVEGITGHMDCKIDGEVVDIKTASKFAFNKFKEGTLADNDPFGYLSQLAAYESAEGTEGRGFFVINKESGELCLYRPDDLEKPNIKQKINKTITQLDSNTKPDFCYPPVPEGKKGNMKLDKNCTWCKYKFECHAESNDGAGLRTFKYSSGPAYFTKVKVEPRVQEIL